MNQVSVVSQKSLSSATYEASTHVLPTELLKQIFAHLSTGDRITCMCTCRSFKKYLEIDDAKIENLKATIAKKNRLRGAVFIFVGCVGLGVGMASFAIYQMCSVDEIDGRLERAARGHLMATLTTSAFSCGCLFSYYSAFNKTKNKIKELRDR